MQRGGNAVDAAIAVATALSVVEPQASGIGGDGFIMIYWQATGRIEVVNATGAAPLAATREKYLPDGIPTKGIRSTSIPALVDGLLLAHARYGQLSLSADFEPAIGLAENGFPVSHQLAQRMAGEVSLYQFPSSHLCFTNSGEPYQAGAIWRQPDLGRSFRLVAAEGRGAFYEGEIARAIARTSAEYDGLITEEDLKRCHAEWVDPIVTSYHDYQVYESPPNSSGHVLLQELNIIEQLDLASTEYLTSQSIHNMVEAKRLAFADREAYMADPNWWDVPIKGLLSKEYAKERANLINQAQYASSVTEGDPWLFEGRSRPTNPIRRSIDPGEDTTCFVIVDGQGNAVCQLQSVQSIFGSGLVAAGTGILLNNRMTYWHLDRDHPNCLQPGKRVRHTMNTVMVTRDGRLYLVCGTPGADTQVQTNLQVITGIVDYGLNVVEAVEAPRWRHLQNPMESTIPHICDDKLHLESRFPNRTIDGLRKLGHPVQVLTDWGAVGSEMAIQVDTGSGVIMGAADPRRDGYAVGW
jgi:gamma-glutamyltranspeptidase/glutathione hydrolase